jgi:hypothetical protein
MSQQLARWRIPQIETHFMRPPDGDVLTPAARLFVSPRTVQAHLTHICSKLETDLAGAARPGVGAP